MKQVIQSYATGKLELAEVPPPALRAGCVLAQNRASAVSVGTEKLTIDFARKNLIGKALARQDMVRRVITKARTDGILEAFQQATNRLDTPVPLGYSCAGQVIAVGAGVTGFQAGERVACAGQGHASHAEIVCVPKNLCVKIPDGVDDASASFVMLGAIALHGVRMAQPALGENIAVIGLGLLGLMTVQMLKAAGCRVCGMDIVPDRVALARELGADAGAVMGRDNVPAQIAQMTHGVGADAVLILASTPSNEPIMLAGEIVRARGRIVAVGMVRLDVPRNLFYEKELSVVVSRSSGPGIYDSAYEQKGIDYPLPYVRWTEQRNMEEFLALIAAGKVRLDKIITHRFPVDRALDAYALLMGETKEPFIGAVLEYERPTTTDHGPQTADGIRNSKFETRHSTLDTPVTQSSNHPTTQLSNYPTAELPNHPISIGLIGAGLFAKTTLLPALKKLRGVQLRGVASATGATANHIQKKFGFDYGATDYHQLLNDADIDAIIIATRHNLHARLTMDALRAGKRVFVEKPLALNREELQEIVKAVQDASADRQQKPDIRAPLIFVGFNRRFAPHAAQARQFLAEQGGPFVINCRVNAGSAPRESWVNDPAEGGGRIVGEVCHFIDLIQYLTGALPARVFAESLGGSDEDLVISLQMQDGSIASIAYTAQGDRALPRERVEVFAKQSVCVIDNFRSLTLIRNGKTMKKQSLNLNRGHHEELETWLNALRSGVAPVDFREYVYTTLATFAIEESLRTGMPIPIRAE